MSFQHPSWSYSANIYEVNLRQYSAEGTFAAFQKHLPRLWDMGVKILWFMPVTPISLQGRKGSLGSYYAVQNYMAVNPEFGSIKDFINLVKEAQALGFKIIIDWVANHTGNDNLWIQEHPDFYCYDESNKIIHPGGWEDVSKLNYQNEQMQSAMIDAMRFWIDTCNIDGYRCDMAHLVPLGFWKKARTELQKWKTDLFWLAECEDVEYHEAFDATYTWKWMHASEEFYKKHGDVKQLLTVLQECNSLFPQDAFRTYFTSNHDENTWNGTEYEKYGDAAKAFAVFSCTWNGVPMIYSGQELPNHKRLEFFEKDVIEWSAGCALHDFYKILLNLHKTNTALRAGDTNVVTYVINTNSDEKVFSFLRTNGNDAVFVILNLSEEIIACNLYSDILQQKFVDVFNKKVIDFSTEKNIALKPWDYKVFEKIKAP
jgi:glycosidase